MGERVNKARLQQAFKQGRGGREEPKTQIKWPWSNFEKAEYDHDPKGKKGGKKRVGKKGLVLHKFAPKNEKGFLTVSGTHSGPRTKNHTWGIPWGG